MPRLPITALASVLVLASILPAQAQSARVLGDFRDWSAYAADDGGGTICFAMTKPKSTDPVPADYGEAYLYVTDRPGEDVVNEFNLVAGYTFQTGSVASVSVDPCSPRVTPPGSTMPASRPTWPPPSGPVRA